MSTVLPYLRAHAPLVAALVLLTAGGAYGVAGQSGDQERSGPSQVRACVDEKTKVLTKTTAASACPEGSRQIAWNLVGRRGAAGSAGVAGQPGATGPSGAQGTQGAKGAAGEDGAVGPTGAPGPAGAPGPTGPAGPTGPPGAPGTDGRNGAPGADAVSEYAQFYALSPPDNVANVAPGTAVDFPQNGPTSGSIARVDQDSFNLAAVGTYRVSFSVPVMESGQLVVTLNGVDLPYTVSGRATGTSTIAGEAFVQTTLINSVISIRNPAGNSNALTITPLAGGSEPVAATLIIEQLD